MAKYRKKPIVIEATQWHKNGDHPQDACVLIKASNGEEFPSEGKIVRYFRHPDVPGESKCKYCGCTMFNHGWIDTYEGGHNVCPGDYIITGIEGEHYPCKDTIFRKTYERVE
jgi:hypothetical protein